MTTATQAQPLAVPGWSIPLTGGVVTGIPQLDQLHEPTLDRAADENSRANCVFTCNAMLSRYYRPDLNADGDAIKDSSPSYGQGYTGFASQDTLNRDGTLAKWGTSSWRVDAPNRASLLARIIQLATRGTPSIVTIPSMWGSQPSQPGYNPDNPNFYTHACVFAGTLPDGTCVLANPWGGFLMYYSQADLALRLCYLCAYPVVKAGGGNGQVVNTQGLGTGDAGIAQQHHSDVDIPEIYVGAKSVATLKDGTVLYWDGASVHTDQPAAAVRLLADDRNAFLQQLTQLKAQVADLTAKLAKAGAPDPVAKSCRDALATFKSALAEL